MRREPNLVAGTVILSLMTLALVIPAIFFRSASIWAILIFMAPFAIVDLLGVWLLLGGFSKPSGQGPDSAA